MNILIFKLINHKEIKNIVIVNYVLIILAIIFSIFDIEKVISKKNFNFDYSGTIHELGDIYSFNVDMLVKDYRISISEIELMNSAEKYSKECEIKKENKIPFITYYLKRRLFYSMTGIIPTVNYKKDDNIDIYTNEIEYDKFLEDDKIKCIMVSNEYMEDYPGKYDIDYDDYEILYKNKSGKLIKKKS